MHISQLQGNMPLVQADQSYHNVRDNDQELNIKPHPCPQDVNRKLEL